MIQFTLRLARSQNVAAATAVALIAIIAAVTGPHLVHLYDATAASCGPGAGFVATFAGQDSTLRLWLGILVIVVPAVLGMFWGAPLVAGELEAGTFRLAWTQSVTRTRWLTVRLAVIGLPSMAVAGLFSFIVSWWASPLEPGGDEPVRFVRRAGHRAGRLCGVRFRARRGDELAIFLGFAVVLAALSIWRVRRVG